MLKIVNNIRSNMPETDPSPNSLEDNEQLVPTFESWRQGLVEAHQNAFTKTEIPITGKDGQPKNIDIYISERDTTNQRVVLFDNIALRIADAEQFSPSLRETISPLDMKDAKDVPINLRAIAQFIEDGTTLAGVRLDEVLTPDTNRLAVPFYNPDYTLTDKHPLAKVYPGPTGEYKMVDIVHSKTPLDGSSSTKMGIEWNLEHLMTQH